MAVVTDIPRNQWYIGAGFYFACQATTDGLSTGTPQNMSAIPLSFTARREGEANPFITKTSGAGSVLGDVNGNILVTILSTDTQSEADGQIVVWTIKRTDTGRPVAHGRATLTKDG